MSKRILLALIALAFAAVASAQTPYKLFLKDGTVLGLDKPPQVRGETAVIVRTGMEYTLPLEQVDLARSERENRPPAPGGEAAGKPEAGGPRTYTNEDLPRLKETAPLAGERAGAPEAPQAAPAPERPASSDAKLSALYDRQEDLRRTRAEWLDRLADFQQQRDALLKEQEEANYRYSRSSETSTRGAEQKRWEKEQKTKRDRLEKQIAEAKAEVQELDDRLEKVRQDIYRQYDKSP